MKVKCISNSNSTVSEYFSLTTGKQYDVLKEELACFTVINDDGNACPYHANLFEKVEEDANEVKPNPNAKIWNEYFMFAINTIMQNNPKADIKYLSVVLAAETADRMLHERNKRFPNE